MNKEKCPDITVVGSGSGGEFHLESVLEVDENQQEWLCSVKTGEKIALNSQMVINTTGYGMAEFLSKYFHQEYSMRFWKCILFRAWRRISYPTR